MRSSSVCASQGSGSECRTGSLREFGIGPDQLPTAFNIFMNVLVRPDGELSIEAPLSRPGDAIELHAERDLIVGLTSCSAEKSVGGCFGPIDFEVLRT